MGGLLGFSGLGLFWPGGFTKQGGTTTIHPVARCSFCSFTFISHLPALKLSNNVSFSDLRTKLFSEHAGRCGTVAIRAALVSRAERPSPPGAGPRHRAPKPPVNPLPNPGLFRAQPERFAFVLCKGKPFLPGHTNLGGELPCGPRARPPTVARPAIREDDRSGLGSQSSRPECTPAGEGGQEPRRSGDSGCWEAEEELSIPP